MRGLADKALRRGLQRGAAEPAQLRRHRAAVRRALPLRPDGRRRPRDRARLAAATASPQVVVAGYSLGGNLALKLAGDYGDAPPPQLRGVCAVSPVMELEACVRALERRQNFVYQWNFVRGLEGTDAPQGAVRSRPLRARAARRDPDRARVRRGLHRAALRLRERAATTTTARARCASSIASACRR